MDNVPSDVFDFMRGLLYHAVRVAAEPGQHPEVRLDSCLMFRRCRRVLLELQHGQDVEMRAPSTSQLPFNSACTPRWCLKASPRTAVWCLKLNPTWCRRIRGLTGVTLLLERAACPAAEV